MDMRHSGIREYRLGSLTNLDPGGFRRTRRTSPAVIEARKYIPVFGAGGRRFVARTEPCGKRAAALAQSGKGDEQREQQQVPHNTTCNPAQILACDLGPSHPVPAGADEEENGRKEDKRADRQSTDKGQRKQRPRDPPGSRPCSVVVGSRPNLG